MAVIGITLNEVLRDFLGQMAYTYSKYYEEYDIENNPVTDFKNLHNFFKFDSRIELNTFLYSEHSLEVFGHGDQLHDKIFTAFNNFITDIIDEEEHEVIIISREAERSIPATLFFLSKLGCKANNIKFVTNYEDKWNGVDVMITANPQTLECKPEGKISVKVEATYNVDCEADYTINKLNDFMGSLELQNKILKD